MPKDWKHLSYEVWSILIKAAKDQNQGPKKYTYTDIGNQIGTNAQSVGGGCLGYIQDFCKENNYPALTALVVRKDTGEPGDGFDLRDYKVGDLVKIYRDIHNFNWAKVDYHPEQFEKVELQQFIDFVKAYNNTTLETLTHKKYFHINVSDTQISFTPESTGKVRTVFFKKDIEEYLKLYNQGARKTTRFNRQQVNTSYFLAIMAEYKKPNNRIFSKKQKESNEEIETEKETLVNARKGQGKFREKLLKYWGRACAVTKVRDTRLLRASHIKPWRDSNNKERLDKFNGLMLTPNLDALFDRGLITFDGNKKIRISKEISEKELKTLGVCRSMSLWTIDKKHMKYLEYHRKKFFPDK